MNHRSMPPLPSDPMDIKREIRWLMDHAVWTYPTTFEGELMRAGCFDECIDVEFVFVDPQTNTIEDDDDRNTDLRIWIEAGPWYDQSEGGTAECHLEGGWHEYNRWIGSHDSRLDCGGRSAEEALLKLARHVRFFYNDDGSDRDRGERCEGSFDGDRWCSGCAAADDGFCRACGYEML